MASSILSPLARSDIHTFPATENMSDALRVRASVMTLKKAEGVYSRVGLENFLFVVTLRKQIIFIDYSELPCGWHVEP